MGYNDGTMQVISDLRSVKLDRDVALTIGSFDGVHRGHQQLLSGLIDRARSLNLLAAALTFYPHPRVFLQPDVKPRYLSTDAERARIFARLGLDLLLLLAFDRRVAESPADEFVRMLHRRLHMRELWVGPDFRLGKDREAGLPQLHALADELGFRVHTVQPIYDNGEPISSTRIRRLLDKGDVARAATLLGRYYSLSGIVLQGARRGRKLGFRTANLRVRSGRAVPADGVYAVRVQVDETWHHGVANVGRRPSFDLGERLLEAHLIGFDGDLYGRHVCVAFVERLRGEERFDDTVELKRQITRDIARALEILGSQVPMEQQ